MSRYLRLAEPPTWVLMYPRCSACDQDLSTDGGDWYCESCGTCWPMSAGDGDVGELPDPEDVSGPVVQNDDAWRFSGDSLPVGERNERIRDFYKTNRATPADPTGDPQ